MRRSPIWLVLMAIITVCVFWYAGGTLTRVYRYFQLSHRVAAESVTWSVVSIGSDRYVLRGAYVYLLDDQPYVGVTRCLNREFRNHRAAIVAAEQASGQTTVWYNPRRPGQSTIERTFPLKLCIYSTFLLTIAAYFVGLGLYLRAKEQTRSV